MSLSNRSLWVLIILWFIWVWYIFYQYFFVQNLVSLNINSSVSWYDIELYNLKAKKNINCPEKMCSINEISPFEYELKITKKDYEIYKQKIDLSKSKTINIDLKKILIFEKLETWIITQTWSNDKKTREEIISEKTNKKQKIFDLKDFWRFSFLILDNSSLDLKYKNKTLANFADYDFSKIYLEKVYSSENMIFIELGDLSYILNLDTLKTYLVDLKSDILYTKYLKDLNSVFIVTKDWTFILNLRDFSVNYFSKYSDFINVWDSDIFILNETDKIRKKNLWLDKISWNLIVLFDQTKKTKSVLKSLDIAISKIYLEKQKVYIEDENNNKYLLDNYK